MSDDIKRRPALSRYNSSVMPRTYVGESSRGSQFEVPWRGTVNAGRAGSLPRQPTADEIRKATPPGYRYVGHTPSALQFVKVDGPEPVMGPVLDQQYLDEQAQKRADSEGPRGISDVLPWLTGIDNPKPARRNPFDVYNNGIYDDGSLDAAGRASQAADAASIYGPLGLDSQINGDNRFLFDRGTALTDLETGDRAGFDWSNPIASVTAQNMMTVAGGVKWLRGLSVRDVGAYNKLVTMLRDAGYLSGADEELPLGGYTTQVGQAFAMAANDLSQGFDAGDRRTLMEYLGDRGSAYAKFQKEQEAEQAKEDEYKPVDRQYQDPATIKAAAYDAARAAIGRKLTDEEEKRLAESFRAKENATYDKIDDAGRAETSFAVEAPDMSGQVDDFLHGDEFELERKRTLLGDYAGEFMRMMGQS